MCGVGHCVVELLMVNNADVVCQFVRFYGFYLTAFVVIQILMVLSWQLMMLDEKGAVHLHTRDF